MHPAEKSERFIFATIIINKVLSWIVARTKYKTLILYVKFDQSSLQFSHSQFLNHFDAQLKMLYSEDSAEFF